ncbi:MAG: aminoglycoside 6-adenylyltransferase [Treponema sp.]|jgi:aminoglycoside 6-adenylyltransferase|nr:aminoglycoside 6-adenylyltransferase [Treponema sp.]
MRTEQEMLESIMKIAKEDERIRAVYMHGSRANPFAEKDKYSDYDIVYIVTEISSFTNSKAWLNSFGNITFVFEGCKVQNNFFMKEINDLSCRYVWCILLEDGNHIDLMIELIEEAMNHIHIKNKLTIVLLDKDNCLPEKSVLNNSDYCVKKPHEDEYSACCSGFWWFLNTVAKGIARDQLPYAKEEFYSKTITTLNRMIEWYIGMQTDFSVPKGNDGKYYKKYLPENIYNLYTKIYSDGNYANFWDAVFYTCELFNKVASSVGDYFGYVYNKHEENSMVNYLAKVKSETLS